MVCVLVELSEGLISSKLPDRSMSPASEQLWTTPCSFATLPVFAVCWTDGERFTLLPVLVMCPDGEAALLCILLSENPWEAGGQGGWQFTVKIADAGPPPKRPWMESITVFVKVPPCVGITVMVST
jgi:hypothetical protein